MTNFQTGFENIVITLGGRITVVDQVPALLQVGLAGKGVGIDGGLLDEFRSLQQVCPVID